MHTLTTRTSLAVEPSLVGWRREARSTFSSARTGTREPPILRVLPDELAELRALEMEQAAQVLELAGHHTLGHPDGEIEDTTGLREQIVRFVRELRPDAVLCPDPTAVFFGEDYLNHRDHRITGFAVLDALSPAAALPNYFPAAGPAHQTRGRIHVGDARADRLGGHLGDDRREGRQLSRATRARSPIPSGLTGS